MDSLDHVWKNSLIYSLEITVHSGIFIFALYKLLANLLT